MIDEINIMSFFKLCHLKNHVLTWNNPLRDLRLNYMISSSNDMT